MVGKVAALSGFSRSLLPDADLNRLVGSKSRVVLREGVDLPAARSERVVVRT